MAPSPKKEVRAANALFESMWHKVIKPTPEQKAQLRAIGYDPDHPQTDYPGEVNRQAWLLASKAYSPGVPDAEAYRRFGRAVSLAYLDTLVGKVLRPMIELAGPKRALPRTPKVYGTGYTGVECTIEQLTPGDWRLVMRDFPLPVEGLQASALAGLELTGAKNPRVDIEHQTATEYVFRLKYDVG